MRLERLKVEGDQQEEWEGLASTLGKLVGGRPSLLAGLDGDWVMQMVGRMASRLRVEGWDGVGGNWRLPPGLGGGGCSPLSPGGNKGLQPHSDTSGVGAAPS